MMQLRTGRRWLGALPVMAVLVPLVGVVSAGCGGGGAASPTGGTSPLPVGSPTPGSTPTPGATPTPAAPPTPTPAPTATPPPSPTPTPAPAITVTVTPPAGNVNVSQSLSFSATVTGGSGTGVVWSVLEVGGGTVTSGGVYTAPAAAGVYHIVATSAADPTRSASAEIQVHAASGGITVN
jgi:hypothetical protein